jgi:hypothetical protein
VEAEALEVHMAAEACPEAEADPAQEDKTNLKQQRYEKDGNYNFTDDHSGSSLCPDSI